MPDERRAKFRCISPDDRERVVMRRGRKEYTARLVDQSAEGYAVAAGSIRAKVGQEFRLRTSRGWSEVEVVRVEREENETLVGLNVLRELPDPRDATRNSLAWISRHGSLGSATRLGPVVQVGVVVILAFWLYVAYSAYR